MSYWYQNAVFYQIYPYSFCGAPRYKEENTMLDRLSKISLWIPHLKKMGVTALYLNSIFESMEYGYDISDLKIVDKRLGNNKTFKNLCDELHKNDMKIIIDAIFNYVGRDFWAFKDVQKNGVASKYCGWFQNLNFGKKSPYGDEFCYEGIDGRFNLVKLNLRNPNLINYLFEIMEFWINEFDIDGIKFDSAEFMDFDFFKRARKHCKKIKPDFWLLGDISQGDYKRWVNSEMLDSATNYELCNAIYNTFNEENFHILNHLVNKQYGNLGLYKGMNLFNFADNHVLNKIMSSIKNENHVLNIYTILYTIVGVPSIYYGSEFSLKGEKINNFYEELRPCLELEELDFKKSEIYNHLKELGKIYKEYVSLRKGSYQTVLVEKSYWIYKKEYENQVSYIFMNLTDVEVEIKSDIEKLNYYDVFGNSSSIFANERIELKIPPFSSVILVSERDNDFMIKSKKDIIQEDDEIIIGGKYKHYKGGEYEVVGIAKHTETLEELVIYRSLDGTNNIWARPKSIFMDYVEEVKRFDLFK